MKQHMQWKIHPNPGCLVLNDLVHKAGDVKVFRQVLKQYNIGFMAEDEGGLCAAQKNNE